MFLVPDPQRGERDDPYGDVEAAADALIGRGGLYIAIWIIALTTLWVRHEEHEAG